MEKKVRKPYYLAIASHFEGEGPFPPSMVEPCNNLSLEQIVKDYTRGIVHPSLNAMYDEGDDIPDDMQEIADLTDLQTASPAAATRSASPATPTDGKHSAPEGGKPGPGTEGAASGEGSGEPQDGSPDKG